MPDEEPKTQAGLPFRPCVGICLFNPQNKVFVGERIDTPGSWQMPQGGIDPGENLEQAFYREMREELGTDDADILKIMDRPLRYELPRHLIRKLWNGRYGGQEQTWIAARFMGEDSDIKIFAHNPPEFQKWQWVSFNDILDLIVPFKRDTYVEVIREFAALSEESERVISEDSGQ